MGVNIWNKLTIGISRPAVNHKRKLWYEYVPGVLAFPAVTFGRKRKLLFGKTQYLIIYRYDIFEKTRCVIEWIDESRLIERCDK
jgi:hypothetical protein